MAVPLPFINIHLAYNSELTINNNLLKYFTDLCFYFNIHKEGTVNPQASVDGTHTPALVRYLTLMCSTQLI